MPATPQLVIQPEAVGIVVCSQLSGDIPPLRARPPVYGVSMSAGGSIFNAVCIVAAVDGTAGFSEGSTGIHPSAIACL
ncbi:MAG: hypothetical protein LBD58_10270 [Treponema sp.]|nr:hypothetical protein [Treponema sp.]